MLEEAYTPVNRVLVAENEKRGGGEDEGEKKKKDRKKKRKVGEKERRGKNASRKGSNLRVSLSLSVYAPREEGNTIGPTLCRPSKKRTPPAWVPLTASSERVMKYTNTELVLFK